MCANRKKIDRANDTSVSKAKTPLAYARLTKELAMLVGPRLQVKLVKE
jgi:hypothetical protein